MDRILAGLNLDVWKKGFFCYVFLMYYIFKDFPIEKDI